MKKVFKFATIGICVGTFVSVCTIIIFSMYTRERNHQKLISILDSIPTYSNVPKTGGQKQGGVYPMYSYAFAVKTEVPVSTVLEYYGTYFTNKGWVESKYPTVNRYDKEMDGIKYYIQVQRTPYFDKAGVQENTFLIEVAAWATPS